MLADDEKKPGTLCLLLHPDKRNDPQECPGCRGVLSRTMVPETIGELWGNPYNKKKTVLGPSDVVYPPTRERQRKKDIPTRHIDMSSRALDRAKEIGIEERRAPTAAERPPPGVSVKKGD